MIKNKENNHRHIRLESLLDPNNTYFLIDLHYYKTDDDWKKYVELANNLIKKGTHILFDNSQERYTTIITDIYEKFLIPGQIDAKVVMFTSNTPDVYYYVNEEAKKHDLPTINCLYVREWEYYVSNELFSTYANFSFNHEYLDKLHHNRLNKKYYKKVFVNLNRRWRLQRPVFVGMLAKRNLLSKGFVSLNYTGDNESEENYFNMGHHIVQAHKDDKEIFDWFNENLNYMQALMPLRLDLQKADNFSEYFSNSDFYYENSCFSVVTETNFYNNPLCNYLKIPRFESAVFISEKTFRPMIFRHPFILVATPNTLEALRNLGYKTFHPYINEDYDKEPNDGLRILKILDELERLCNLSHSELKQFLLSVNDIVEHNFKLLCSGYTDLYPNAYPQHLWTTTPINNNTGE